MKRLTALATLALALGATGPALAGASVIHQSWSDSGCSPYPGGAEYCWTEFGTWRQVDTPSGNTNYKFDGTVVFEITLDGAVISSGERVEKFSRHFQAGELHVFRYDLSDMQFTDYAGVCQEATIARTFQVVNGNVVRDSSSTEYVPCE